MNPSGRDDAIMNDCEAVDACIASHSGLGFFTAIGVATYDGYREFKKWHGSLKGGVSDYEKERVARGASSHRRKISFHVKEFKGVFLENKEAVKQALSEGWLPNQGRVGWRNPDGSPRRSKYMIDMCMVPSWVMV